MLKSLFMYRAQYNPRVTSEGKERAGEKLKQMDETPEE